MLNMLSVSGSNPLDFLLHCKLKRIERTDGAEEISQWIGSGEDAAPAACRCASSRGRCRCRCLRAREAVMRQFRPSLRRHDLTEQQWRILRALAAIDAIEVTELARTAFLLGPSLSRILRDLDARGLIERKSAKTDLRRGVISISEKGLRLMEVVAPSSEAIYAAITRRYGARKLAELQDMLGALEASLAGLEFADELGE